MNGTAIQRGRAAAGPVQPMDEPAEREVLRHDEREGADCDPERDGDLESSAAVVLRDRCRRDREVQQRLRDRVDPERRDEEAEADDCDGERETAPHGPAATAHLGAEVEGQARADEKQCSRANRTTRRVHARLRGDAGRHVREHDAAEDEQQDQLRNADHEQCGQEPADRRKDEKDDPDGQDELERRSIGIDPRKHRRQQVVDHERDRVGQVEEVGEGPDPALHQCRRASRRGVDERGQSTRRDDAP